MIRSSRALKRVKSFPVTLTEEDLLDINAGKRRQQRPKKQAPPSPVKVAAAEVSLHTCGCHDDRHHMVHGMPADLALPARGISSA